VSLKFIAKRLFGLRSYLPSGSRAIFLFHDVSPLGSPSYHSDHSTKPDVFEKQLIFLKKKFIFVDLKEVLESDSPKPLASVTFDDGFLSVLEFAHPILKKHSIPYSIFLNKCAIENGKIPYPMGTWKVPEDIKVYLGHKDLEFLKTEGVCLGSHTLHHKILAKCDLKEEAIEIRENKFYLENLLGIECDYLAAPFGKPHHISPNTLRVAREVGHFRVFSTVPQLFHSSDDLKNNYFVPRIPLLNNEPWEINFLMNRSLFGGSFFLPKRSYCWLVPDNSPRSARD